MDTSQPCITRLLDQNFGLCISSQDILLPYFNNRGLNYFRPWVISPESGNKDYGSTVENEKNKVKITLDVQHFQPNEICVRVSGNDVVIEGKHEEREDEHGLISRQFRRQYSLPKDCLADSIVSSLSSDGVLIITVNKASKDIKDGVRQVPIQMCDSTKVETKCSKDAIKEQKDGKIKECQKKEKTKECQKKEKTKECHKEDSCKTKEVLDKKDSQIMLKEEHCRLLKPELLQEAASGKEKLLTDTRKETEELLKLMSMDKSQVMSGTEKIEEMMEECKKSVAELSEKMSETNISSTTEMSSSKMSEIIESSEAMSSVSSSMISTSSNISSSSMKATSATSSDLMITAQLKDAAEMQ